jgi:hypothetical protein
MVVKGTGESNREASVEGVHGVCTKRDRGSKANRSIMQLLTLLICSN